MPFLKLLVSGGFCDVFVDEPTEVHVVSLRSCSRPLTVVLGADSLEGNEASRQTFRVLRSIPHPDYNQLSSDIMLLKVSPPAQTRPFFSV